METEQSNETLVIMESIELDPPIAKTKGIRSRRNGPRYLIGDYVS